MEKPSFRVIETRTFAHRRVYELKQLNAHAIAAYEKHDLDFHQLVAVDAENSPVRCLVAVRQARLRLEGAETENFGVPGLCCGGIRNGDSNVVDRTIVRYAGRLGSGRILRIISLVLSLVEVPVSVVNEKVGDLQT